MDTLNSYAIDIKPFRAIFYSSQSVNALLSIATFFIIQNLNWFFSTINVGRSFLLTALFIVAALATIHSRLQKKRLTQIVAIQDFDIKVRKYETFYRYRMFWFVFASLVSAILAIFTNRMIFFYFTILEFVMALPGYPTLQLFRKELQNDEIILS